VYPRLIMRRLPALLAAALLAARFAGAQASASAPSIPVLSMQAAIDAALAKGDDIRIAQGNLDAARAQNALNASKAGLSLAGSGSYTGTDGFGEGARRTRGFGQDISGGLTLSRGTQSSSSPYTRLGLTATQSFPPPGTPPYNNTSNTEPLASSLVGLTLSQILWDGYPGGQTKAAIDKSLLSLQGKELAMASSRSSIAAKVRQAYIVTLTAQRTLALRLEILDKLNATQKQIQAIYALKQASEIDLASAQISARGAELDVETSRHDLSLAGQRLALLMGLSPEAAFSVEEVEDFALPAAGMEEAVSIGLAKRIDMAQLELSRRSSSIDAALALAGAQPTLTLTGGLSVSISWASPPVNTDSANLGLRIALPILDAGAAKAQVDAAAASIGIYQTQASQLAKSIAADIRDAYWTGTIMAQRVELAKRSWDLGESKLALVRAQNQYGTATNQDLLGATVDAANAEAAFLKSRSDYLLAALALQAAMGL
jgi:outer membrane protein TolC